MNRKFTHSVVSNAELVPVFSLGEIFVSDFLRTDETPKYPPCELKLGFDPVSKVVQLMEQPPLESLWGSFYWYLSGTNPQMREALKDSVEKTINAIPKHENKKNIYVDCASNDGTALSFVPKSFNFIRIGIDPSKYDLVPNSTDIFINDYFSKEAFYKSGYKKCRYFSANAVFYDLESPELFLSDLYEILEDDGIASLQLSYTPANIMQCEVGVICHEHLCYYCLLSLKYLTDKVGFVIRDIELNNVNGGSIKLFLQKEFARNFKSPADKDICDIRVNSLLEWEKKNGYDTIEPYKIFFEQITALKKDTVDFIVNERSKGKTIWAYGASTKGNTLLSVFGLNSSLINGIAEKQERKWGLKTVGSNIPIFSESDFRKAAPDYCLILPWFFGDVFKERESEYLKAGGKFIFPAPHFYVYPE